MQPVQEFGNPDPGLFQAIVEQAPDAVIFADSSRGRIYQIRDGRTCEQTGEGQVVR